METEKKAKEEIKGFGNRNITQSAKRHLQDVLEMSFQDRQDILQMSKRCLKRKSERHLEETFARYIVDVLQKTS